MIPWRAKRFFSDNTPVAYYLLNNLWTKRNSHANWDEALAATWNAPNRQWPNRCTQIMALTDKQDRILDVGCGTGSILRTLLRHGYTHLHGVEHSQFSVDELSKCGIEMQQSKLPAIPFSDATFDVVIASEVLEHILFQSRLIQEMLRVTKPGGRLFIFVPNNCLGPIDEPTHVRKYTERTLRSLLNRFGRLENITETTEEHFPASFLFANLRKTAPRA